MSNAPLLPKATAVWRRREQYALTFDQWRIFTKDAPARVRALADGDAAQGIKAWTRFRRSAQPRRDRKGRKGPELTAKLG